MTNPSPDCPPADVCLLLRAHAETRWLSHEVVPVLRELESASLSEDQLEAARAYLEALWIEARDRAAETDAARRELDAVPLNGNQALHSGARRYHAAVRRLRIDVGRRVRSLLELHASGERVPSRGRILSRGHAGA
jgi:hypothetical protein